jgi:general secretion pathway protein C
MNLTPLFKRGLYLGVGLGIAFAGWGIGELFLPHFPPLRGGKSPTLPSLFLDIRRPFFPTGVAKGSHPSPSPSGDLKSYKLTGLYQNRGRGFVVLKRGAKTFFVDLNGTIDGYRLVEIRQMEAVFEKGGKKYFLTFPQKSSKFTSVPEEGGEVNGGVVSRQEIEKYQKNPALLWQVVRFAQTPKGFKVTYLKPGSPLAKLGLKEGDTLLEVNGVEIKSVQDAWKVYQSLNRELQKGGRVELQVTIQRNNQIKVLNYEIE